MKHTKQDIAKFIYKCIDNYKNQLSDSKDIEEATDFEYDTILLLTSFKIYT